MSSAYKVIAGVAVGELLVGLAIGQDDLVGVDDDDIVAAVLVGGELGLVLPTEQVRGLGREAAEDNVGGINDVPVLLDVAGLRCVRVHGRCLRFSWCMSARNGEIGRAHV